jgi:2-phosphoglycerate kinase
MVMYIPDDYPGPSKEELDRQRLKKYDDFIEEHRGYIDWLMDAHKKHKVPYETVDDLVIDMLDDVVEVWYDNLRKEENWEE